MGDEEDDELLQNAVGELKSITLNVTTGFMEEKAEVHALTLLINNGGFAFLKHLEENTVSVLASIIVDREFVVCVHLVVTIRQKKAWK